MKTLELHYSMIQFLRKRDKYLFGKATNFVLENANEKSSMNILQVSLL